MEAISSNLQYRGSAAGKSLVGCAAPISDID